jgi:hypothetical protein
MVLLAVVLKQKEEQQEKEEKKDKMRRIPAAIAALLVAVGIFSTITTTIIQSAEGYADPIGGFREPKAPMAASQDGNNVYVVWWTNRSGNWEVMFRASNDGGQTFGDRINLSNSPDTQSQTAEILAVGNSVYVTWWELNENVHPHTNESVLRVSTDAGQTFGPVINLGTNGTISSGGGNSTDSLSARGGGAGSQAGGGGGGIEPQQ